MGEEKRKSKDLQDFGHVNILYDIVIWSLYHKVSKGSPSYTPFQKSEDVIIQIYLATFKVAQALISQG